MEEQTYGLYDNQGMLIEKSSKFDTKISYEINDITWLAKEISDEKNDDDLHIDIAFEKGNIILHSKNNQNTLCVINEKKE